LVASCTFGRDLRAGLLRVNVFSICSYRESKFSFPGAENAGRHLPTTAWAAELLAQNRIA
jgi:hypothetical protein